MPTLTEIFINSELPKRPYTNQFPLTAGHVPVATGVGLEVEARILSASDISDMSSYATQGDLSNVLADTNEYADGLVVGLWDDRGAYTVNAAGNINYPSSAGSGVAGALMKGDIFTVAGAVTGVSTVNNIAVNNGDTVRALVDNPSATDNAHWVIAENNIGYVPENTANKTTNTDLSGAAGTYPDTPTVKSYIDNYDISAAAINTTGTVTLTRTESDLTFQVPTAISGLSFDANTGVLTSSYTNNAVDTTITVAANEVSDNVFRIKDDTDATKKIAFQASAIGASQTRTITMPDANVNLGKVAQAASGTSDGYLASADWNIFNNKGSMPIYTTGVSYKVNDFVTFANALWRVTTDHTGVAIPDGRIELIGDKLLLQGVSSGFSCYKLGNETTQASKELELWISGSSDVTINLNNAPVKVVIRTTNAFNITGLTLNRSSTTFYSNADSTSIGNNSVTFKVAGGSILELTVYSSEVLVHKIQQPMTGDFKIISGGLAASSTNAGWTFTGPTTSSNYSVYLAAKDVDLGNLSSVATTDGNALGGTRNRIVGGGGNNVSGTDNIVIGGSTNTIAGTGVVALSKYYTGGIVAHTQPRGTTILGTSLHPLIIIFDGKSGYGGACAATVGLCTAHLSANGTTYNITTDGEAVSNNNTPYLVAGHETGPTRYAALGSAVHDVEFIVTFGLNIPIEPSRTFYAKRRVYAALHTVSGTPTWATSTEVVGTDTNLGPVMGTVTIGFTLNTANNRLIPTVSATVDRLTKQVCV